MRKAANLISIVGIISLFTWISFFAALVGEKWRGHFLFVITILLLALVCLNARSSFGTIFNKHEIPFWIFLITMGSGLVNGTNQAIAYYHFWTFIFIIPFVYFFTKLAFRKEYEAVILRSICLMGLLVSVYGIIEFVTGENFIYKNLINNFCYDAFKGRRMMSTHIHPAPLGTYLVAIFPISVILTLREKRAFLKSLAIISALVIFIGIILTFSRSAFLGVFMALSTMLFFLLRRKRVFFISALILLAAAITVIGVSSLLYHYHYSAFQRLSLSGLSAPYSYLNKMDRIVSVGNILKDHTFFGLGFDHYRIFFDHYLPHWAKSINIWSKVPDCLYLLLLTETGLVGFAGFMLFIVFLFKKILDKLKSIQKYEDRLLLLGFFSGFIGIMCTFLTYDAFYWNAPNYLFWSYAGILSFLSTI